jgi:hypothetical protein
MRFLIPVLAAAAALLVLPLTLVAVPAPSETTQILDNYDKFFPNRQQKPLPGKVVGLLLADGQQVLSLEGRSGPANQLVFSADGNSYRWVYVQVDDANPQISNLRVAVGDKGETKQYPKLAIASLTNVKKWNITAPFTLVEVEVNDGLGSPAGDSFVATKMTVLEGTGDYPANVARTVADLKKRYESFQLDQAREIDEAFEKARKEAIGDAKPTGPRETSTVMYATWLSETKRLQVRFFTKVSDGLYTFVEGGVRPRPVPLPVNPPPPPPPVKEPPRPVTIPPANAQPAAPQVAPALPEPPAPIAAPARPVPQQAQPAPPRANLLLPPPPPPLERFRTGTQFGIQYGAVYEVSSAGTVTKTQLLPPKGNKTVLPPPPVFRNFDLPPPPAVPPAP